MKYKIVLEEQEEGFAVSAPNLPGCHSQGATEDDALENIKDAIREYLAAITLRNIVRDAGPTNDEFRDLLQPAIEVSSHAESPDMRHVEGYSLWLGHVGDVDDSQRIITAGILAVVDLALNESPASLPRDRTYCRFPLIDGTGNPSWILRTAVETVACMLRSGTPTLVYCSAGLSRSPCVAGAAIAVVRGCSLDEGLKLVLQSGPADVSPGLWSEIRAACAPADPELVN